MRIGVLAACFITLSGCSTRDIAEMTVLLQEMNGSYWPNQSSSEVLQCRSGDGYLVYESKVRSGVHYVTFHSASSQTASVSLEFSNGDRYEFSVPPNGSSGSYQNHPGYEWDYSWAC
jgi:hypothetical protein